MNPPVFQFGQPHPDYAVPVLNERAVRASAGLLFLVGLVAFMNAWLVGKHDWPGEPDRLRRLPDADVF